jgi:hypothetical protein
MVDNGFLRPFTVSPVSDPGVAGPLKVRVGLGAKTQIVELVLPLKDVLLELRCCVLRAAYCQCLESKRLARHATVEVETVLVLRGIFGGLRAETAAS